MNWPYIAGFFDGEGTAMLCSKSFRVAIPQTNKQVLQEIQRFLHGVGIRTSLSTYPMRSNKLAKKPIWVLNSSTRESVVLFLRATLPFLRVKKVVAQDILRYAKLYPKRGAHGCILRGSR